MTSFWYKPSLKDRLLNAAMLRTMSNEDTNDDNEPITYQWLIDNYQSSIYTDVAFIYCGNFRWECFNDDLYKFGTRIAGSAQKWRQPQTRGELRTLLELTTPPLTRCQPGPKPE